MTEVADRREERMHERPPSDPSRGPADPADAIDPGADTPDPAMEEALDRAAPELRRRLQPRRGFWHRNGRRIGVGIAGFALILAGAILALPLVPGPGTLLVIAGLAVLATEFTWAERLLHRARERFEGAARRSGLDPKVAAVIVVLVFVVGAAVVAALWSWLR